MKTTKSMAVIYEDAEARHTAVTFCDCLVNQFWGQFDLSVSWWELDSLRANETAMEGAKKASEADFVIFAGRFGQTIPEALKRWVEMWLKARGDHEGALVGLPAPRAAIGLETSALSLYLRGVAHRAGMDYLTEVPQSLLHPIPESPDSCTERAHQITSVLDEILHSPHSAAPLSLS